MANRLGVSLLYLLIMLGASLPDLLFLLVPLIFRISRSFWIIGSPELQEGSEHDGSDSASVGGEVRPG